MSSSCRSTDLTRGTVGCGWGTNCFKAREAYKYLVKMKKKGGKLVKDTMDVMLASLHKDILTLMDLTAGEFRCRLELLRKDQRRVLEATMKMYFQQEQMHRKGEHRCDDRIVSIFQPHVRPIVRGKASAKVEFGSKIGVSIVEGYNYIDHHLKPSKRITSADSISRRYKTLHH